MAKNTLSFVCQNCGAAYNRWQGKCESCGEWNTLAEEDTTGSVPVSIRSKRKGRTLRWRVSPERARTHRACLQA